MRRTLPEPVPIFEALAALLPGEVLIGTDLDGHVTQWNRGAEQFYGYAAAEAIGQPIAFIVPPDRAGSSLSQNRAAALAGEVGRVDTVHRHKDGTRLDVQLTLSPLRDASGRIVGVASIHHDLPRVAERALPLRAMVERLPSPALYRESGAFYFNDATAACIGYSRREIPTFDAWFDTLYGADGPAMRALYDEDRRSGCMDARTVLITRKDGSRRFLELAGHLTERAEVWLIQDVTERRDLERALLEISEREQRRIGRDLHDGLGAHLTGVAMLCRSLARRMENSRPVSAGELAEVADLVQEATVMARGHAHGLNPVRLEQAGLVGALQELANSLEQRTGVRCRLVVDQPEPELPVETATHLYRIAQEACSNAVKHSGTDEVVLALLRSDDGVTLRVSDRGSGLPPEAEARGGLGLHAMRYRAGFAGARFVVEPAAGGGTVVSCTLSPLPPL